MSAGLLELNRGVRSAHRAKRHAGAAPEPELSEAFVARELAGAAPTVDVRAQPWSEQNHDPGGGRTSSLPLLRATYWARSTPMIRGL